MKATNNYIDRILQNRILAHLLFWGVFLFMFVLLGALNTGNLTHALINYLALLPVEIMAAYFLVYYQFPRLLLNKKYLSFIGSFALSAYVFATIARLCVVYFAEPYTRQDFEQESLLQIISDPYYLFAVYFPIVYVTAFLMLALKLIKERLESKHQMEVLRSEKVATELKFLKAQIHPHFLFNTLNNLYALTLNKSDDAPKVVLKLSEMLDYMLYQCNEPEILVEKEIELIHGYMDLEMLRYGNRLDLQFNHRMDNKHTKIAPLILLSLIENSFKHGASSNPENPFIHIDFIVEQEQVNFRVVNTKMENVSEKEIHNHSGIGILNVRRQLELNYPNRHELTITDSGNTFVVDLKIDLKKNES